MRGKTLDLDLFIKRCDERLLVAIMSLGLINALEHNVIDVAYAQKILFRPGVFEKCKHIKDVYRILNLGEELEYIIGSFPDEIVNQSFNDIKELCYQILSESEV